MFNWAQNVPLHLKLYMFKVCDNDVQPLILVFYNLAHLHTYRFSIEINLILKVYIEYFKSHY